MKLKSTVIITGLQSPAERGVHLSGEASVPPQTTLAFLSLTRTFRSCVTQGRSILPPRVSFMVLSGDGSCCLRRVAMETEGTTVEIVS